MGEKYEYDTYIDDYEYKPYTNTKLNNNTKYARTNKENKKHLKINLLCDRYFQTSLKNDNGRPFSHNAK